MCMDGVMIEGRRYGCMVEGNSSDHNTHETIGPDHQIVTWTGKVGQTAIEIESKEGGLITRMGRRDE